MWKSISTKAYPIVSNVAFTCSLSPTKVKQIERYLARFYRGQADGKQRYHWSSWTNLCYPKEEGGVGFRYIMDVSKSFAVKRWWRFRTSRSVWAEFLRVKYCSRVHPAKKKRNRKDSHCWKNLLEIREKAENIYIVEIQ